jgi:hypothetical protein
MSNALTVNFHYPERASAETYSSFTALTVHSDYGAVTFYLPIAADVQSIADAFNAVLSPKAKDTQDAE